MKIVLNWLLKPFKAKAPGTKDVFVLAFGFGAFISLFITVFQPFGLFKLDLPNKFLYLFMYGPLTSIVLIINYLLLPKLFRFIYKENTWNVYKELLYSVWTIFFISVLNWYYTRIIAYGNEEVPGLFVFFLITGSIGIIPMVLSSLILERRSFRQELGSSISEYTNEIVKQKEWDNIKRIKLSLNRNKLMIFEDELICVQSLGNYCNFYYLRDNELKKELVRDSLKNVIETLNQQSDRFYRCHKSYIINKNKIRKIKGNSRAYKLELIGVDFEIPVSRSIAPVEFMES
jgi:hypothetical protein